MANFNGQAGSVTYNMITHSVTDWKGDWETPEINTTSTGAGGFYTGITGPQKFSGTFKMFLDSSALATGNCIPGYGTQATLSLLIGNTAKAISGTANILKATIDNPAEDGVTYEVAYTMTGSFTVPS